MGVFFFWYSFPFRFFFFFFEFGSGPLVFDSFSFFLQVGKSLFVKAGGPLLKQWMSFRFFPLFACRPRGRRFFPVRVPSVTFCAAFRGMWT